MPCPDRLLSKPSGWAGSRHVCGTPRVVLDRAPTADRPDVAASIGPELVLRDDITRHALDDQPLLAQRRWLQSASAVQVIQKPGKVGINIIDMLGVLRIGVE